MKITLSKFSLIAISGLLILSVGCSKSSNDVTLPPIGGYNNANEVGATDLIAHWAFEGNGTERISNAAAASAVNATYSAGAKGQCVSFAAGYLAYNPIPALTASTASYSVSAWINVKNNSVSPNCIFTMTRPGEWAGNYNLTTETGWYTADKDTLVVKGLFVSREGSPAADSWQDSRPDPIKGGDQAFKAAGSWAHVVITWDAISSKFLVYGNGVKISNPDWELRTNGGSPVGDLVFNSANSRPVIGAWGTNVPGPAADAWQVPMTGKVDELRVWKKALTATEITSLYELEKAGR